MPAYSLVINGVKQKKCGDYLDSLWKSATEENEVSTSVSSSDTETVKRKNGKGRIVIPNPTMKIVSTNIVWKD